jgi:hypothetical protein
VDVALRGAGTDGPQKWDEDDVQLQRGLSAAQAAVHESLLDNINTRGALDAIQDLVKATNLYLARRQEAGGARPRAPLLRTLAAYVTRILSVFGLVAGAGDVVGLGGADGGDGGGGAAVLDAFCSFRDEVRQLARARGDPQLVLDACDRWAGPASVGGWGGVGWVRAGGGGLRGRGRAASSGCCGLGLRLMEHFCNRHTF